MGVLSHKVNKLLTYSIGQDYWCVHAKFSTSCKSVSVSIWWWVPYVALISKPRTRPSRQPLVETSLLPPQCVVLPSVDNISVY